MIATERLLLRPWRAADAAAHNAIRAEPHVAAMLGGMSSLADSEAALVRHEARLAANGFCFWAAERRADGRVVGWCGLQPGPPPIAGDVEIGWTLAPDCWGQGLAREAAAAVLAWAWAATTLPRILAITTPGNARSLAVMERLGMTRVLGGDFDHPALPEGDPLRRHVTYCIERQAN